MYILGLLVFYYILYKALRGSDKLGAGLLRQGLYILIIPFVVALMLRGASPLVALVLGGVAVPFIRGVLEPYLSRWLSGGGYTQESYGNTRWGSDRPRMTRDEAYEVLGLTKGSSRDDIIAAHRRLMKKLHPDLGGSTALAARVNQARDILLG